VTTAPSSESPGGTVVVRIDRFPNRVPNSAIYAVTFAAKAAMGAVLLSRVQGLDALRVLLRKLNLTGAAAETACAILTERQFHEIDGVTLTPRLIRELSV